MSKIKENRYIATIKTSKIHTAQISLKDISGIYMITNKISKKFYIGMSNNLKKRFYNYLDINRLNKDKTSRINRALLKYGFDKFAITILELHHNTPIKSSYLREREDFFIKVFKPQYNIKRSTFNKDIQIGNKKIKSKNDTPTKVKNLLDKCLDPNALDWNLVTFKYYSIKGFYYFIAITPKSAIKVNSQG